MAGRLYLFAGGGTGGHLFPGIAVAECLVKREPDARILFVGSDRSIERDILQTTPFEHRVLPSVSLAGATRHPLRFLTRSWSAHRESVRLMQQEQPTFVIGCGGFASAAPVFAASRVDVPFVLLEQNVIPGRATRWLCRRGGPVCLSYEQTASRLPTSAITVVTGNPVRREIVELCKQPSQENDVSRASSSRGTRTLLVLGGSQGARAVNASIASFVDQQRDALKGWRVVHQTGAADVERMRAAFSGQSIDATVSAFFDRTVELYRQASLVVSRAGGTSLSEIACAGLPAILLPYPHAADDHQRHNAAVYGEVGAAIVLDTQTSESRSESRFTEVLSTLLTDDGRRQEMAGAMQSLARPDAAESVADFIIDQRSRG